MQFINLTPHAINIHTNKKERVIEPSGQLARCAQQTQERGEIDGIPVELNTFGAVEGLPQPQEGIAYIVSSLVLSRVPERADVFAPANPIRDDNGQIIGCAGLSCTPAYTEPKPEPVKYWQVVTGHSATDKVLGYYLNDINAFEFSKKAPANGYFMGIVVAKGGYKSLEYGHFDAVSDVWHRPYVKKASGWEALPLNYGFYGYGDDWVEPMTPYQEDEHGFIIRKMFEL